MKKFSLITIATLLFFWNCETKVKRLDVYNWPYYITEEMGIIKQFEKEFNCIVNYKEFPSNEVLLTQIKNNSGDWDVIFPSDYMVEIMRKEKSILKESSLLKPLNHQKLTNLKNIDNNFLNQDFDPNNKFSIPFSWGVTGIGFNKSKVDTIPTSYSILWENGFKNKIGLLDDVRFTVALPLLLKGFSINTTNLSEVKQAEKLLLDQKSLVKTYNSENYVDFLKNEEVYLFYGYSGDIIQAMRDYKNLDFVIPKEGGVLYLDNVCIPWTSNEDILAHDFINFLLRPDIAAIIINSQWFAVPNIPAKALVIPEIKSNQSVYPTDSILARCQSIKDVGDFTKEYESVWRTVKSK